MVGLTGASLAPTWGSCGELLAVGVASGGGWLPVVFAGEQVHPLDWLAERSAFTVAKRGGMCCCW